jgi:malate dehydrogenase (oxaloacetate-decarboxylating)
LLLGIGNNDLDFKSVKDVIMCDSKGIIHSGRTDINSVKKEYLTYTNLQNRTGNLHDAMKGADVFVGVSVANLLTSEDIKIMNVDPIIFAMANPNPEIMPEEAYKGGAAIVGTGRSDFPNQVNNVLGFPGIFRGALDARAKRITIEMKIAAANAIAACVENPTREEVIPSPLNKAVAKAVAKAVYDEAMKFGAW